MENKKGIQALDDSVLDSVTGGLELRTADAKDASDTVRHNLFGNDNNQDFLEKVIGILWDR